jgi:hypothetical protein
MHSRCGMSEPSPLLALSTLVCGASAQPECSDVRAAWAAIRPAELGTAGAHRQLRCSTGTDGAHCTALRQRQTAATPSRWIALSLCGTWCSPRCRAAELELRFHLLQSLGSGCVGAAWLRLRRFPDDAAAAVRPRVAPTSSSAAAARAARQHRRRPLQAARLRETQGEIELGPRRARRVRRTVCEERLEHLAWRPRALRTSLRQLGSATPDPDGVAASEQHPALARRIGQACRETAETSGFVPPRSPLSTMAFLAGIARKALAQHVELARLVPQREPVAVVSETGRLGRRRRCRGTIFSRGTEVPGEELDDPRAAAVQRWQQGPQDVCLWSEYKDDVTEATVSAHQACTACGCVQGAHWPRTQVRLALPAFASLAPHVEPGRAARMACGPALRARRGAEWQLAEGRDHTSRPQNTARRP